MKIDFQSETKYGTFSDALHFPDDQVPSAAEIEAIKQQRVANWLAIIEAPPQQLAETPGEGGGSAPRQEAVEEQPAQE